MIDSNPRTGFAFAIGASCVLLWVLGCVTPQQHVVTTEELFYRGDYRSVASDQLASANVDRSNAALAYLTAASALLCLEDYDAALRALEQSSEIMWSFADDGSEREAIRGREESKVFRGDPCEKSMAAFYIGMIDYMNGDFEKALASFKTSILADAGARDQFHQCDCPLLFFMQGKTYQALDEPENADESFDLTRASMLSRHILGTTRGAVVSAVRELKDSCPLSQREELLVACEIYLSELCLASPDIYSPADAFSGARERVAQRLRELRSQGKAAAEADHADWPSVEKWVDLLGKECARMLQEMPNAPYMELSRKVASDLDELTEPSNNVIMILDLGHGPFKSRAGGRDQTTIIQRGIYSEYKATVHVSPDDRSVQAFRLADTHYQASTRGGREFDVILENKATFKDTVEAAGALAFSQASIYTLPVTLGFWAVNRATKSEADIRFWSCLPGEVHVACAYLSPGEYSFNVNFLDPLGNELTALREHRERVKILESRPTLLYFR